MRVLANVIVLPTFYLLLCPLPVAGAEPHCLWDSATSLSVPDGGKGVCLQGAASSRAMLHYAEEGILIAQIPTLDAGGSRTPRLWHMAGDEVRLLYCSASLLDSGTGAPTSACLGADGSPGTGAFVGSGRIQASAAVDAFGSPACPSFIHVRGVVHSPGGEAVEIQSSLVRFWDSASETECQTVRQDISTNHLGRSATLRLHKFSRMGLTQEGISGGWEFPELDPDDLALLERISNLDDTQFELLTRLIRVQPADWRTLTQYLETEGEVHIARDGTLGPPRAALTTGPSPIKATTNQIFGLLNAIAYRGAVRNIKGTFTAMGNTDNYLVERLKFINGRLQTVDQTLVNRTKTLFNNT